MSSHLKLSHYVEALRLGAIIDGQNGQPLQLVTATDSKPITLNTRNYASTSGTDIAVQSKPNVTGTGTVSVVGAQFSPRFASGVNGTEVVGVQSQPLLKGGSTTLTGDFGGFEADLTDSQTSGNTIGGDIYAYRAYQNMASQTVTGDVVPIRVDAAGSTLAWTTFAKLPDDGQISKSTTNPSTAAGYIKVKIGSSVRYIQLYSTTPS
jgi:hypothetical protein